MKPRKRILTNFLVGATVETLSFILLTTNAHKALALNPETQSTESEDSSIIIPQSNINTNIIAEPIISNANSTSIDTESSNTNPQLSITNYQLETPNSPFSTQNSKLKTQNSLLLTQNSTLNTQNSLPESKIQNPKSKILTPAPDTVFDVAATSIILQYAIGTEVKLQVNGVTVDSALIGRTETDAKTNLITQTWYGVSLTEGENTIAVQTISNGVVTETNSIKVQVRGVPKELKVKTRETRVSADGRSTITVEGELLDENGNRSNRDAIITLVSSGGEFAGIDRDPDVPGFQVEAKQGQYTASLRSSLQAQTVRIRATTLELEAFTQAEFETSLRPSIATGVINIRLGARGTDYYRSFREFLPPDGNNKTQLDINGAVFATGKLGNWLFTGAFNSDRPLNQDCNCTNRLFRDVQSSEQNYAVYGDQSKVDATTPSTDQLYLRFERSSPVRGAGTDYFMWGDYNTDEFATSSQQFSATTRQLHGFKSNYNLGNLQATVFYGNNVQGFQRDTIVPDGTSGYYFLSRRLLVPGSEDIFIELEEFDRPGTVIERQKLNRGPDYEIDYDRGTLLFRNPLLRTAVSNNGTVLVRRIVSTYQYDSQDNNANIYGGRVRYFFARGINQETSIGATYLKENQGTRNFELYGADAFISLGQNSHLIAEYAHSQNTSDVLGVVSGSAYRLELDAAISDSIKGRAYYRHTDTGFANNATVSFVPGQTRYGAELQAKVSQTTNLRFQYDHEDNNGIAPRPLNTFEDLFNPGLEATPGTQVDNSLTTISAGVQQKVGSANVEVDWIKRHREDRLATAPLSGDSSQLRSRLTYPVTSKLTFRAQNELNLSSQTDTVYPNRTIFGLDWAVFPGVSVQLNHQFFEGGQYSTNSITSLDVNANYKLGSDTTLLGRYSLINGQSMAGSLGIQQGIKIAPGLKLSLAYEHIFGDLFHRTGVGAQSPQPYAVGQSASSLGIIGGDSYSVGLEYTDNPNFQASARYEHRTSSAGSNTVITASAFGKLSPALTALARYQQAGSSNQKLTGLGDTVNFKVGLAYRNPDNDKFNALLRYEYRKNPATIPDSILIGSGTGSEDHVFALEAIYAPNWRWELYGKYAIRNSVSYLAADLLGGSTVSLGQVRATYRLGYRMDLVGEARLISQPAANYSETAFVVEAGYYLTPNLRAAVGYSFGNVSDRDLEGSRSGGGLYAGLTVKLNDLFNGFGLQKVAPRQQQESNVKVTKIKTNFGNGTTVQYQAVIATVSSSLDRRITNE